MISVEEALERLFALVAPLPEEEVTLTQAGGRVLARDLAARRTQPPFSASAMDGYALRGAEAEVGARFEVIGEAAAGAGFAGEVGAGQAVRIFTGAPLPPGADAVVIQEEVETQAGGIRIGATFDRAGHVRAAGTDFREGDRLAAPRLLSPSDVALLAAMNYASVPVRRRPEVAIIATGDELVQPGEDPGPDQIVASNSYGLHALLSRAGAHPRLLPIARDSEASLRQVFALAEGADLILTIGGASVGDHDLVGSAAATAGLERTFYKVAMRPGKPLMAGSLGHAAFVGLPGNPVSAMVCGTVFILPMIRSMQGFAPAPAPRRRLPLTAPVAANGPREHYMRARLTERGVAPLERQDSSLLSVLSEAGVLIVRGPDDAARDAGETVEVIDL